MELVEGLANHAKWEMFEGIGEELEHLRLKGDLSAVFKSWNVDREREICLGAEIWCKREADDGSERGG